VEFLNADADGFHSPNERFSVEALERNAVLYARILQALIQADELPTAD
jgi:acetylornithine deacetylase/succinyl-diaminopimelate desuccinylase-like protein